MSDPQSLPLESLSPQGLTPGDDASAGQDLGNQMDLFGGSAPASSSAVPAKGSEPPGEDAAPQGDPSEPDGEDEHGGAIFDDFDDFFGPTELDFGDSEGELDTVELPLFDPLTGEASKKASKTVGEKANKAGSQDPTPTVRPEASAPSVKPGSKDSAKAEVAKGLAIQEVPGGQEVPADQEEPTASGAEEVATGDGGGPQGPPPALSELLSDGEALPLGLYAERSYLEYAVSVVKGRALPDVCDGQKPVQRRILYTMHEMGLGPTTKPVKSARVVGDVIGRFHPHGDQAAYDAMVRLAQGFSMRYPLVDGQGNFGSRDGDGAAAMRYTEARLTRFSELLLSEIERGTVDFVPNYDGAFKEPAMLPARLPVVLLNGASGIAVGMATEIPSHNLREVGAAAVALIENPDLDTKALLGYIQGPDCPGGGQLISSQQEILMAYESGRGSLKMRARYKFEELARNQWQLVVTELPPAASSQKVLEEIEELTNPKIKVGKKTLTQEQTQVKQLLLSVLDGARDESGKEHAVRLVFEPKTSKIDRQEFVNTLLTYTSLESSLSLNMVMIGRDGRPRQKNLRDILREWVDFRFVTVRRRTRHRLDQVLDRIHILEGRYIVFLNVDEVIRIVRNADDPKADLIARFNLSDRQAEDILEIRLRQLARLEGIKIEQELSDLRKEQANLETLLGNEKVLQRQIVREIEADTKAFGDDRRTLIQASERASLTASVVDEPITVILSEKGWIRSRSGHNFNTDTLSFKEGDRLASRLECRSVDTLVFFASDGRVYNVATATLPGGKGDGVPITTFLELQPKEKITHTLVMRPDKRILLAGTRGYGFACKLSDLSTRNKAGKQFVTLEKSESLLPPLIFDDTSGSWVATVCTKGRLLVFALAEVKVLAGGGKGVILMGLDPDEDLEAVRVFRSALEVEGQGRGARIITAALHGSGLEEYLGKRARKGRLLPGSKMRPMRFLDLAPEFESKYVLEAPVVAQEALPLEEREP